MKSKRQHMVISLAIAFGGSELGCAAIFRGTQQEVRIESSPSGAEVRTVQGGVVGKTPTTLKLDRSKPQSLVLAKPGYEDRPLRVKKNGPGAGWLTLDILTCVLVWCPGVIVDGASGAWNSFDPPSTIVLEPSAKPAQPSDHPPAAGAAPSPESPSSPAAPPAPSPNDLKL